MFLSCRSLIQVLGQRNAMDNRLFYLCRLVFSLDDATSSSDLGEPKDFLEIIEVEERFIATRASGELNTGIDGGVESGFKDTVVRGEGETRNHHVFNEGSTACVVPFVRRNSEITLRKQDKVF